MSPSTESGLVVAARSGDRRALAKLISLVENDGAGAHTALAELFAAAGGAWVTALTGAPGAGKSTLTDRLLTILRGEATEVAVVAVDPSSPFTGGAILGDRVRMQDHIDDPGVYVRSLATRGALGGISEATPRVLSVLDGVGFPELLVETVGVGQAEVEVAASADTTIVVLNPRWGDSVQAAKAGLLEVGDIFVVNKADRPGADDTVRDLKQMLELGSPEGWWPPIVTTVATAGQGVEDLWSAVGDHRRYLIESGRLTESRQARRLHQLTMAVETAIQGRVAALLDDERTKVIRDQVEARTIDPWTAAGRLLDLAE